MNEYNLEGKEKIENKKDEIEENDENEEIEESEDETSLTPLSETDLLKSVKVLRELLDRMQVDVVITTKTQNDARTIFISGPDSGLLVGKQGQTLDALHFIFNRILHRKLGINGFVDIDVDGYRSRRELAIKKMAIELAKKAKKEGKIIPIQPMNARDRRIVHMTLSGMKDIKTESEGSGKDRHVKIIPLKSKD